MNIEEQRKAFQEWIKNEDPFAGNDDNQDCIWAKKYMWEAWLASANRQGFVLVPKEPTQKMIDAMDAFDFRNDYADMYNAYIAMIEAQELNHE